MTNQDAKITIADAVRVVLITAKVPKTAHAKTLSNLLDISVPHAYRKLSGAAEFTFAQIEQIEASYGVRILSITPEILITAMGTSLRKCLTSATLVCGSTNIPCVVQVGLACRDIPQGPYVAYLSRGKWYVKESTSAGPSSALFEVEQVSLDLSKAPVRSNLPKAE